MAHLYILEGSGGLFKLGRTRNFVSRFQTLKFEFKRRGEKVARMHFFPDTTAPVEAELEFLCGIRKRYWSSRQEGREWFRDVDFDFAVRCGNAATRKANRGELKTFAQVQAESRERSKQLTAIRRAEYAERCRRHEALREMRLVGWMAPICTASPAQRDAKERA